MANSSTQRRCLTPRTASQGEAPERPAEGIVRRNIALAIRPRTNADSELSKANITLAPIIHAAIFIERIPYGPPNSQRFNANAAAIAVGTAPAIVMSKSAGRDCSSGVTSVFSSRYFSMHCSVG